MADELRIKVVLDTGEVKDAFVSLEKQSDKTAKKIGNSFDKKGSGIQTIADGAEAASNGLSGMAQAATRAAGPYGALAASVAAASAATFKMALAGEKVNAVNAQFSNLAISAGLNAEKFKDSIIAATQGLIDDEAALQIATKGIVALGDEAKRLPQILDAARNVSRAFGKDFKDSFGDLSQFVETGNARILKNYGIILDLDKAYEKAAKSIGLTAAQLTEQQKQTVRANELLDQVPKKFGAAAASVTPLKDALDKLKVSAGNALEDIFVGTNKKSGPLLTSLLTEVNELVSKGPTASQALLFLASPTTFLANTFKEASSSAKILATESLEGLKTKSVETSNQIDILSEKISNLSKEREKTKGISDLAGIDTTIISYRKEIDSLKKELTTVDGEITKRVANRGAATFADNAPNSLTRTAAQNKLVNDDRIKQEQELSAFLFSEQLKRVNNEIQLQQTALSNETSYASQKAISDEILNKQIEAQQIQSNINLLAVDKQFKDLKLLDQQEKNAAIQAAEQSHEDAVTLITKRAESDRIKAKKAADQASIAATSNALGSIATLQENATGELAEIGKAAAITKATIDGYTAVQNALAQVPYPFNFAAATLVGVAAAANVAKIASVGGGGGGSSFSPDTGGGIAATPSTSTDLTATQDLQRAEASTGVSVVIQGDVLDSDESGSRIVNLINQAFDKKGVVINQGVMA